MGKRSFADFQSQQQQISLLQQQQQQQQQQPFALLQKQQQFQQQQPPLSLLLQQQYLMRSVKQRTNNFAASPISPLSSSIDLSSANNSRFGVPVYQQQLRSQQQQPLPLIPPLSAVVPGQPPPHPRCIRHWLRTAEHPDSSRPSALHSSASQHCSPPHP